MKYLLLLSFMLNSLILSASTQQWNNGELVLKSGEILSGKLNYNLESETVQVRADGKLFAFNASQISQFSLSQKGNIREFVILNNQTESGYVRPQIFELLLEDKEVLLGREYVAFSPTPYRNRSNRSMRGPMDRHSQKRFKSNVAASTYIAYDFFSIGEGFQVVDLKENNKVLISLLSSSSDELKKFFKNEKIEVKRRSDLMKLLHEYESLN